MEHEPLTRQIIGGGMKVHRILGPGYLESVYKNALSNELRAQGLHVEREVKFKVFYEGNVVGDYLADMHVEGAVLVEVKAARAIVLANEKQLVNYLTGIRAEVGLLLNFGAESLQVRRKVLKYRPPAADRWSAADRGPKRLLSAETATAGTGEHRIGAE